MGHVRKSIVVDADELAPILRRADLNEMRVTYMGDPALVLRESILASDPALTVVGNTGLVAGLFGVVGQGDGSGVVWMMGSDELTRPPLSRQFIVECRHFIRDLRRNYSDLHNTIDERNTVHSRWLLWAGFEFTNRIFYCGEERLPFLEFKLCAWQVEHQQPVEEEEALKSIPEQPL